MQLLYDRTDLRDAERRGDLRLGWLRELGAISIEDAPEHTRGFLFGYQLPHHDFTKVVGNHPFVRDTPEERAELSSLEGILRRLELSGVVPQSPRTWVLDIDAPLPTDLTYPLFVRTSESSWKRG